MSIIGLYWRTARYLTARQLLFQVLTRVRNRPKLHFPKTSPTVYFLTVFGAGKPASWRAGTFTFLNKSYSPQPGFINWNYGSAEPSGYGKLWTYNLNYFDFLNQPDLTAELGLPLMLDFIRQTDSLRDGLESYPTSLRIMNWVQFLSRNQIQNNLINTHLVAQTDLLSRRLEYNLAGNHLLENCYALLLSSLYFRQVHRFQTATRLIKTELGGQILVDGGHNERSPMYHQLLLDRLLTVLLALQNDTWHLKYEPALISFLTNKAHQMLDWLNAVTFRNGDIPMVNDATFGIAPTTAQLRETASYVLQSGGQSIASSPTLAGPTSLNDSGYRMFRHSRYELFANVGSIGPDHQPGHAHADTLSFVLYVDNFPLIVDSGLSTYQTGPRRQWERSTTAHNTVTVEDSDSSETWAGFRVGYRARVNVFVDTFLTLKAQHDGYRKIGVVHEREWFAEPHRIGLTDCLISDCNQLNQSGIARFYVHPSVQIQLVGDTAVIGPLRLSFVSVTKLKIYVTSYDMAEGFNYLHAGQCLNVLFTNSLETTFLFSPDENTLPDVLL